MAHLPTAAGRPRVQPTNLQQLHVANRPTANCTTAQPQDLLKEEQADYEAAVAAGPAIPPGQEADLGMRVVLVHG